MAPRLLICASVLLAGLSLSCAPKDGSPEPRATVAPDPRVASAVGTNRPTDQTMDKLQQEFRWDEFEQMIVVLGLQGDQQKVFRDNMAARAKKLEAHKASDLAKQGAEGSAALRQAEQAKDEKKIAEARAKYGDAIKKERAAMEDLRRIVMGPLSPQQRLYWAQYVLYRGLWTGLKVAEPTPAQLDQWWALCGKQASELVAADYVGTDPYLAGDAAKSAAAKVRAAAEKTLTAEQAKKLPRKET
jgi:hypothetical protein